MRSETHDRHLRGRVYVTGLPVHAARGEGAMRVVRHPPLVVIAPPRKCLVAGQRKRLAAAAARDVSDNRCGQNLLTIETPTQAHHFAKASQVAQLQIESAGGQRRAAGIDLHVAVLLHAERAPQTLTQDRFKPLPGYAPDEPAQQFGVGRLVGKSSTVFAFFHRSAQELIGRFRTAIAGWPRHEIGGPCEIPDLRLGVCVGLTELETDPHVEQLTDRGVTIGAVLKLRNVLRYSGVGIQLAFGNQQRGNCADERLRDRVSDVQAIRLQCAKVALVNDLAPMQHDDAVGVVSL